MEDRQSALVNCVSCRPDVRALSFKVKSRGTQ
jgi:hypothetical protein